MRSARQRTHSLAYLTSHRCSVAEALEVAAQAGYAYVGLRLLPNGPGGVFQRLVREPALLRDAQRAQRNTGVGVLDLEIIRIGAHFDTEPYLPLLEAGAALKAHAVLIVADDQQPARLAESYARLCEVMQPYGLTADLEFMPWTAVKDARSALRIIELAGTPANAGILVDALHFGRSTTTLADIRAIPRALLHYAQICDAEAGLHFSVDEMIHTARCARLLPGDGTVDLAGLMDALPADLPISVEVVNHAREAHTPPAAWAAECLAASRRFTD